MRAVLGRKEVRNVQPSDVMSNFNSWAYGAQLVILEEIRVSGQNRYEVMNGMKTVITEDYITVNEKNVPRAEVRNRTNYMLFTNYQDAIAIEKDDRRYCVFFSDLQLKEQVADLHAVGHYDRVWALPKAPLANGLRAWFEDRTISPAFEPDKNAPRTRYHSQLVHAAQHPLEAQVSQILDEAEHPLVQPDLLSFTSLKAMLKLEGVEGDFSDQALSRVLRKEHFERVGKVQVHGDKHYIWVHQGHARRLGDVALEFERRVSVL
jgi:hypothetical protein